MTATVLITLIALTTLSAFLCWGSYSSLRMSGKSKSEAATRAGLVFAATLALILIAAWAFSMPDPDFIGRSLRHPERHLLCS